ncbi:hypothetical protein J8281_04140 [Aquimarina sp. U1-2]|uniref:hypothetical protein n=1 Tax=Aquimarina sp. U1-2 TaxID=2823141 RepID=UPI001AEC9ACD|nr:hypothetical protein [Aquimarina sp. U1-2]MBP2831370.1 hypothetical protein [Aquimarina sp. U1-2]
MKKIVFLICISLIFSCNSDDGPNNPFLPSVSVNFQVNLNLPQYNRLEFPGGIEVERTAGRGLKGVILYNQDGTQFFAYELSDPNLDPSLACSTLTVEGSRASSNCNGNENIYEITSFGQQIQGEGGFALLQYRIRRDGNILTVTN